MTQIPFAGAQPFLCTLQFLDIYRNSEPLDGSRSIPKRICPKQKPTVLPIETTEPGLYFTSAPRNQQVLPNTGACLTIVRMDHSRPRPVLHLIPPNSEIF